MNCKVNQKKGLLKLISSPLNINSVNGVSFYCWTFLLLCHYNWLNNLNPQYHIVYVIVITSLR